MKFDKRRIERLVKYWKPKIVPTWDIDLDYVDEPIIIDDGKEAVAECFPQWEYECARIKFSIPLMAQCTPDQVENTVVHELLHCVVEETASDDDLRVEHVVTQLTRTVLKAAQLSR